MTREAKIGMLTGLGVIVLIGVLLSEYLGGAGVGAMSPTGRMAALPLGAAYRQEVTEPVGVPGTVRAADVSESGAVVAAAPAGRPTMPAVDGGVVNTDTSLTGSGPTVAAPVMPMPAGEVRMDAPLGGDSLPTLQLPEGNAGVQAVYVAGQSKPVVAAGNVGAAGALTVDGVVAGAGKSVDATTKMVKGQEYVIASGDTLGKIATKFYKTSKGDAVARIVAANPGTLKNDKTMLVAGKKLMIPDAPVVTKGAPVAASAGPVASATKKPGAVVIHQPGANGVKVADGGAVARTDGAKKAAAVTSYVVVSGDTFEKIAKKLGAKDVGGMVKKLESVNGIKDPTSLQVGAKLKVPV